MVYTRKSMHLQPMHCQKKQKQKQKQNKKTLVLHEKIDDLQLPSIPELHGAKTYLALEEQCVAQNRNLRDFCEMDLPG